MGWGAAFKAIGGLDTVGAIAGSLLKGKGAKDAAGAQGAMYGQARSAINESADSARKDVFTALPVTEQNVLLGQQAAIDMLGGAIAPQIAMARGGNIAAQDTLRSGFGQANQALLGGPIDYTQMRSYRGGAIPEINTQLPEFDTLSGAYQAKDEAVSKAADADVINSLKQHGWDIADESTPGAVKFGEIYAVDTSGEGRGVETFVKDLGGVFRLLSGAGGDFSAADTDSDLTGASLLQGLSAYTKAAGDPWQSKLVLQEQGVGGSAPILAGGQLVREDNPLTARTYQDYTQDNNRQGVANTGFGGAYERVQ